MARMNLPSAPTYKRTSYSGLLGADFSVDPSLVDKRRSPDLLNMISDNGGNPIKRKGWEIVNNAHSGEIENIWSFYSNDQRYIVFTCKTDEDTAELVCMNEDGVEQSLADNGVSVTVGKHCAYFTNTSDTQYGFYLLDGEKYHRIYYDEGISYEEVVPYVPTILISREPTGGGTVYDDINLLTKARKEQFLNTAGNTTFVVSSQVDTSKPYSVKYKSGENWVVDSSATVSGATFTVSTAHAPVVTGQDNILIEYYATGESKSGQILNCTTSAHFSATVQDQIFLTGNPNKPNSVFYSAYNDISYFPDLNYLNIGGENKIMGFLNLGEYLAVVKEGTSDDSTIFLIYQTSIQSTTVSASDGKATTTQERTFAVKRAIAGIGAISKYAFGVLNDEPLFLSSFGVYGVISTNITSEKIVRNRSFFLDPKLTVEDDLNSAVGTVWNNYYVLFTNGRKYKTETFTNENGNEYQVEVSDGHVYILDGRHKTNNSAGNTSYGYESYYWEGVPAISVCSYDLELWFGTSRGEVCRFKNSGQGTDYSDATVKSNPNIKGVPIKAVWSTPNDNDGASEYFKTMQKKGSMCTVAPYQRSSVKVYLSPDGYPRQYIGMMYVDISGMFDGEIDFGRLSFDPRTTPRDSFFRKKQKKYVRLQIILENDAINEPFGVFEIVKTYVVTRFAKNRAFVQGKGTPTESPIFQRHTITVEDEDGNTRSIDVNGTRWQ